jgi:hypothetical protein
MTIQGFSKVRDNGTVMQKHVNGHIVQDQPISAQPLITLMKLVILANPLH